MKIEGNIKLAVQQVQWCISIYNAFLLIGLAQDADNLRWWHFGVVVLGVIYLVYYFVRLRPKEISALRDADPQWKELQKAIKRIEEKLEP